MMLKNISVRDTHAIVFKYLGRLTFSQKKNFVKWSQIRCFKIRNSVRRTLKLRQTASNDMLQYKVLIKTKNFFPHKVPRQNIILFVNFKKLICVNL